MNTISRRGLVRIISYILALIVVLTALSITSFSRAKSAELQLEYSYLRAVEELNDHMNSIDSTLTKGKYAKTAPMLESLANELRNNTQGAKQCLSQLPISDLHLTNTFRFLSQLGEYALSLSNKVSRGEELTQEEMDNMKKLEQYSKSLREEVQYLEDSVQTGTVSFKEISAQLKSSDLDEGASSAYTDGFKEYEEGFSDFPTLIYDGPFSDHLMQKKPLMLQNKSEISRAEARKTAAQLTGKDAAELEDAGDEAGIMPSYVFSAEGLTISISKAGGYPVYYLKSRQVAEGEEITREAAVKAARNYLAGAGIGSLAESYYEISNGIITINFAALQDDVTAYTDLIKVSVALDTGEVIGFDTRGYLTNHKERTIAKPKLSLEEARKNVSSNLKIKKENLAIIPSNSLEEKLCYEFYCMGEDEETILVYVNANTGVEEQILILLIGDNGTLTI